VILEPRKIKSDTVSTVSPSISHEVMGPDAMIFIFWMLSFKPTFSLSSFTFTFHFHALEKEMATHSSVLAWRISETGEPGGLPSMGLHRVGHNWSDLAAAAGKESACNAGDPSSIPGLGSSPGEGISYPLQYPCLENPQGQRSLEGYSPWDLKESDTTEGLSTAQGPEELNDLSKAIIVIKTPKRFWVRGVLGSRVVGMLDTQPVLFI